MDVKICYKTDNKYPNSLKKISSAPEILYYLGDISICDGPLVCVIGKRDSDDRMRRIARKIGQIMAEDGRVVMNGFAIGCDTEAIKGAVSSGGKAVVILPCGLDVIYPQRNAELANQVLANGGCIISEYPAGTKPEKFRFLQRDKIQAMLAGKVIVVDAEENGGTMYTASHAIKYGRPIGCFAEKNTDRKVSSGNRALVESKKAFPLYNTDILSQFVSMPEAEQLELF